MSKKRLVASLGVLATGAVTGGLAYLLKDSWTNFDINQPETLMDATTWLAHYAVASTAFGVAATPYYAIKALLGSEEQ